MRGIYKVLGLLTSAGMIFSSNFLQAEEPTVLFLVKPKATSQPATEPSVPTDEDGISLPEEVSLPEVDSGDAKQKADEAKRKAKTLDDLIAKVEKRDPLSKKQQRIFDGIKRQQADFIRLLDEFVVASFDVADDDANPEFSRIRDEIVASIFDAPDEKFYYGRLYLLNDTWLDHQSEVARFNSLDEHLRNRWVELEAHRKRIRQIIVGTGMVVGTVAGSYLSFKISQKVFPIAADEKGFAMITKMAGRGTFVLVGAGVGAALGQYAGFLGSDALLRHQRDYVDPIDGTEDLRDLLDVADQTYGKY